MNGDSRSWSTSSFFKDQRLADERCKNTTLYPYTVVTRVLFSPMFKIFFWSASEERKGSSAQERITVPMSSEFVARMHALSSLRLTPAIEVTSFMSSSSLPKRKLSFYASFRMHTKTNLFYHQTAMFTYFGGYLYATHLWYGSGQGKTSPKKLSQFSQVPQTLA